MTNEQLIFKKMGQVMGEIGHIGKNQKNQAQGFKFRGIDDFVNALYPALVKHGVFMTPRCVKEASELREVTRSSGKVGVDKYVTILMEYDFFAEDGSKVTVGPVPAEGVDSGDKSTNKALSAALKYALIQTFSIPTEDMAEADKESPEHGTSLRQNNGGAGGLIGGVASGVIKLTPTDLPPSSQELSSTQPIGGQQNAAKASETPNKKSFRKPVQQTNEEL